MDNSDQEAGFIRFEERYSNYTDAQILQILKNHKDYQAGAIDAAVKIAVGRQLIHSEMDLLSPDFQASLSSGFTLFPEITNAYHRQRLIGSLFRFLYVVSFLPIIYGFLKYGEGQIDQTYLGVGVGMIWLVLCILLKRTQKLFILIPLFALLLLQGIFAGIKVLSPEIFRILDVFILIIGILLPVYFLIFLRKLIRYKSENI